MKLFYFLILNIIFITISHSQDTHWSNISLEPALQMPSLVGTVNSIAFTASHRSQWMLIPNAFQTNHLGISAGLGDWGIGASFLQNHAGNNSLKTIQALAALSYRKKLSPHHRLGFGLKIGILQQSFKEQNMAYGTQYVEGVGFDPNLGNQETFIQTQRIQPDIHIGFSWHIDSLGPVSFILGGGLAHLNTQDLGFLATTSALYPIRWTALADLSLQVQTKTRLQFYASYQQQQKAKRLLTGLNLHQQLNTQTILQFGAAYRHQDAWVLATGLTYKNLYFGLNYDINISDLNAATNGQGAIEIHFQYQLPIKAPKSRKPLVILQNLPPIPADANLLKDSDNDGILDTCDLCPLSKGEIYYQGCSDSDKDGILDHLDACPLIYGVIENKGCPFEDRDTDQDGVLDKNDRCMYVKGDPNLEGCPDSDKDGISDVDDFCPYLKGSIQQKGCPDTSQSIHQKPQNNYTPPSIFLVEFDTDQTIIKPHYNTMLDRIVFLLNEDPSLNIFIYGHTDTEGTGAYNLDLGNRRAQAIQEWLLVRGIEPHRFKTTSFGENVPKSTNSNELGRARNRRAEIVLRASE